MDITPRHYAALGLQIQAPVALEELVPVQYLPAESWENDPTTSRGDEDNSLSQRSSDTLSNGAAIPSHEVYYNRKIELSVESADAYHFLSRSPPKAGTKPVKIVHFRMFWLGLQQMGGFWDTSRDDDTDQGSIAELSESSTGNGHGQNEKGSKET